MGPAGRRPGGPDTRAEILEAASKTFSEEGYAGASIRGIAQRAGVDPALVHHYFDGKHSLFVQVMGLPSRLGQIHQEVSGHLALGGAGVVRGFLGVWDAEPPSEESPGSFVSLMQAASSSPQLADSLREFIAERIFARLPLDPDDEQTPLRRALVASQLAGLAFDRYIFRLEPLASADPALVARWIGPTIDCYLFGPIPTGEQPEV